MSKKEGNEVPKYIKVLEDEIDKLSQKIDSVGQESLQRDSELLEHIKVIWKQLHNIEESIMIIARALGLASVDHTVKKGGKE